MLLGQVPEVDSLFDPTLLTQRASFNRVKVVDVPGFPEDLVGSSAYHLLRKSALIELVLEADPALRADSDPIVAFDRKHFCSGAPTTEGSAIANEIGTRLAAVLHTLRTGSRMSREARPEWNDSHWDFWAGVEHIVLGGGMVSGRLGQAIVDMANRALTGLLSIRIPTDPQHLPLLGAALTQPEESGCRIVLDCGQSVIKRGIASYDRGKLAGLRTLAGHTAPKGGDGRGVLSGIVAAFEDARMHCDDRISGNSVICVASYVDADGQPQPDEYIGTLFELGESVPRVLADALSLASVRLLHDGTSAAIPFAGEDRTAVVVMGTALGWGVPPAAAAMDA